MKPPRPALARPLIWLAAYPKSGNTWLRLLLANLLAQMETPGAAPLDINQDHADEEPLVVRGLVDGISLIDSDLLTPGEADRLRPRLAEHLAATADRRLFIKIHDAYRLTPDGEPLVGRGVASGVVYGVRDPRDVAVSMAHHFGYTLDKAIAVMANPRGRLSGSRWRYHRQLPQDLRDWSGHVASWLGQTDLPVHVLRYEDLRGDPVRAFAAVVAFLALPATPAAVAAAVRATDFTELRRQEDAAGFRERLREATAPFFRQGRAGAWTEVLSPAQAAAIEAAHGPMMARLGYL